MEDLEHIVEHSCKEGVLTTLRRELLATSKLYFTVIKQPSLLAKGLYHVVRDIGYELPRSLIYNTRRKSLEERLHMNASQALALSEAVTIPGTYLGVTLFKLFGTDDYTASIIGGSIGNYISGAVSCILSYVFLTRGDERYPLKKAAIDSGKIIKDCFPTALALYISEAPIISGLLAAGLSRNMAVGLNLVTGMAIFTGVAKYSATQNIKE